MELKHDPVPFIFEKGDQYTKLSVLEMVGLGNTPLGKELLLDLLKTQRPDGGFPSKIDPDCSGVKETERVAHLLLRCQMPKDGLSLASAMRFLLRNQTEDGGFRENTKLSIPADSVDLSKEKGVTYLTADLVDLLRLMGQEGNKACQKAINWLRRIELPEGGWPLFEGEERIDPDSSAQITFLMSDLLGPEDTLYKRGLEMYEKHLDQMAKDAEQGFNFFTGEKRENDIYHLTHLLGQSFVSGKRGADAGFATKDKRVKKILQAIIEIQREDGGFRPYWSEESDPLYAGLVLRIFLWVGGTKEKEVKAMIQQAVPGSS
jgi:prenyltransferase beta subunit